MERDALRNAALAVKSAYFDGTRVGEIAKDPLALDKAMCDLDAALRSGDGWVSERSAVERERKAFVTGIKFACDEPWPEVDAEEPEAARRYPLPKEDKT